MAQVKNLLNSALEREPGERAAFLAGACGHDDSLRREVEALLSADDQAGSFFEMSAPRLTAEVLAGKMSGEDAGQSMIGCQLGPYSVVSLRAKGGMGEVYRARDTKLGREVAVKVLPSAFALDSERLARFRREARLLASLNHSNVAAIYGNPTADTRWSWSWCRERRWPSD